MMIVKRMIKEFYVKKFSNQIVAEFKNVNPKVINSILLKE